MFGDIGHGGLLFALGIYVCAAKNQILKSGSFMTAFIPARYLLLLMGFFATYCGFIYNDFFSMPWNLFGSCYENAHEEIEGKVELVGEKNR